jgi:hypothetical protein
LASFSGAIIPPNVNSQNDMAMTQFDQNEFGKPDPSLNPNSAKTLPIVVLNHSTGTL